MIYYGVLFVIAIDYLGPEVYIPFLKIYYLIPFALFVAALASKGKVETSDIFKEKNVRWIIFYISLIFISILTADVTLYAFRYFKESVGLFFLYFLIIKEINDINRMKIFFILMIAVHIMLAILNPDVILNPASKTYIRHPSFMGDGNDYSWSVCIFFPCTIFLYLEANSKVKKILAMIALLILMFSVVGAASRGATVALASILLYQWIKARSKIKGIVILFVVVVSVLIYAPPSYFERMKSIQDYGEDGSAQGRIMAWKSAVRMAVDHPLLGVGVDHFAVKFGTEYRPPGYGRMDLAWLNAHSIYFKTLGELGFPGIIFLLWVIISNFVTNEKWTRYLDNHKTESSETLKRLLLCLNSSILGFAVAGAFLSGIKYPHLYVVVALVTSAQLIIKQKITSDNNESESLGRIAKTNHTT